MRHVSCLEAVTSLCRFKYSSIGNVVPCRNGVVHFPLDFTLSYCPLPFSLDRLIFSCENSETELSIMADITQHEYDLLNEIAQDPMVTQANLSSHLGIAVGSVNWYIKRLIHRGWVKVSHLDRTRLKYDLTSEGMSVFTQRALLYARDSLKIYGEFRKKAKILVRELKQKDVHQVNIEGNDEIIDILRLTCIEEGIRVTDSATAVLLRAEGQEYKVSFKTE